MPFVARGLAKAIDKAVAKSGRPIAIPTPIPVPGLVPVPVPGPLPTPPALAAEPLPPPVSEAVPPAAPPVVAEPRPGLFMPARPSAVVVRMVAPGTTREARKVDTLLADGVELLAFSVPVSGPLSVQLRHEEH